ncbi:MAG TPA: HAD-IC family P-type ATPase [Terracidiphilus sp.]|nr:HAD-IC family P-type ATPase [Terracidiphilus sp.]
MPKGLVRYQKCGVFHFLTFSCYRRLPFLGHGGAYNLFESELEAVRLKYGFVVAGYVLMPEHVHLLVDEPRIASLSIALQVLKQQTSRKLKRPGTAQFWQRRYYDFNVWSEEKRVEKLRYMHRNPVHRGLVGKPENWPWSSFRHYALGEEGSVEIESEWTARKREAQRRIANGQSCLPPFAKCAKAGHPQFNEVKRVGHPPAGIVGVADPIKESTPDAIRKLKAAGLKIIMVTGDNATTAKAVADKLGIEFEADVLPQKKADVVKQHQQRSSVVAMAGDGVNDAPALAQADVGIAMGIGSDVAMEAGGITLLKGDLRGILRARHLSKSTMRNIRENLFFAFVYNAVGVPLAAGVLFPAFRLLLNPMIAAAAMSFSSVSVIANALRLRTTKL